MGLGLVFGLFDGFAGQVDSRLFFLVFFLLYGFGRLRLTLLRLVDGLHLKRALLKDRYVVLFGFAGAAKHDDVSCAAADLSELSQLKCVVNLGELEHFLTDQNWGELVLGVPRAQHVFFAQAPAVGLICLLL